MGRPGPIVLPLLICMVLVIMGCLPTHGKELNVVSPRSSTGLNDKFELNLVCSSPSGNIKQVYFDFVVKKLSAGNFSSDHTFDIFDSDGNCNNAFILTGKSILVVYDHWNRTVGVLTASSVNTYLPYKL